MRRYLIVDDNRAFAENLAEICRDLGDEAATAAGGREALERVREARFDAVLTDMRMPLMGGAELVAELRRVDPGVAALVVTAYTADGELEAARREGLVAVLSKPAPVERVVALLRAARRDGLVALVEDDRALSDNLAEALRDRGFAAVTAASVLETERLGPVRPLCAVVDLRVPGGPDGEAMRRLAARYAGLPMIVVTAYDEAPPVPCHALFHKPFRTGELLDAVERLHARAAAAPR